MKSVWIAAIRFFLVLSSVTVRAAEPVSGWRGNETGLWPDSKAPLEWHRLEHGPLEGMRAQADRPTNARAGNAPAAPNGLIAEWLVLGPLPVRDAVESFDDDLIGGELKVSPSAGEHAAKQEWRRVAGTLEIRWSSGRPVCRGSSY